MAKQVLLKRNNINLSGSYWIESAELSNCDKREFKYRQHCQPGPDRYPNCQTNYYRRRNAILYRENKYRKGEYYQEAIVRNFHYQVAPLLNILVLDADKNQNELLYIP